MRRERFKLKEGEKRSPSKVGEHKKKSFLKKEFPPPSPPPSLLRGEGGKGGSMHILNQKCIQFYHFQ